jgi:citrate lyase subunit beta/citryl-CoA lyase
VDHPLLVDPRTATTFLFVPGDRPERFARAASSGADVVVIDLEDGVHTDARPAARLEVVSWLRSGRSALVRLNAAGTSDHDLDLEALSGVATHVMLARAESAAAAESVVAALGAGADVMALVETARGVARAGEIAASPAVARLAFGNVDLSTELGVDADDRQALLTARSLLALASAAAGLYGPVDGVTTAIDDAERVAGDAAHAASLGFGGKLCIHPRQVDAARAGFTPTPDQVAWAERVLAAASGGEARAVDGAMVDRPVEERARAIMRRGATAPDR